MLGCGGADVAPRCLEGAPSHVELDAIAPLLPSHLRDSSGPLPRLESLVFTELEVVVAGPTGTSIGRVGLSLAQEHFERYSPDDVLPWLDR